ncbi:MAG TPA: phosphatase PAP2 family protein [Thermoanaerobaculia bacterium]|nr:phosphatase PAP2 family protein [Thermoanaerobaculia bacterium]
MRDVKVGPPAARTVLASALCVVALAALPGLAQDAHPEAGLDFDGRAASAGGGQTAAGAEADVKKEPNPLRLLLADSRSIFTAPLRWGGHEWTLFSLKVLAVGAAATTDSWVQRQVLRGHSSLENHLATDFEQLGRGPSFAILGGFYLGGAIADDTKAKNVAIDGLIASAIASGVITPALKFAVGRSRPSQHQGTFHFRPGGGSASFPSGDATQAFAVASVITSAYRAPWVQVAAYGSAGLVGFARLRLNGHFASDVTAGALIGAGVGKAVARINRNLRVKVALSPIVAPGKRGLVFTAAF